MSHVMRGAVLVLALWSPLDAQSAPLSGTDCGQEVGVPCKRVLVTEATYGLRLSGTDNGAGRINLAGSFGAVVPVARRIGVGAVAAAGLWDETYLGLGARLRVHASPGVALDFTPTYLLYRSGSDQGRGLLDVAVMYRDRIGVIAQVASFTYNACPDDDPSCAMTTQQKSTVLFAGVRLGSKPGRVGLLVDVALLVVGIVAYMIDCSSGCT